MLKSKISQFKNSICISSSIHSCVCCHVHVWEQRTACGSQFSPATNLSQEPDLGSQAWWQSPNQLSYQVLNMHLMLK